MLDGFINRGEKVNDKKWDMEKKGRGADKGGRVWF